MMSFHIFEESSALFDCLFSIFKGPYFMCPLLIGHVFQISVSCSAFVRVPLAHILFEVHYCGRDLTDDDEMVG